MDMSMEVDSHMDAEMHSAGGETVVGPETAAAAAAVAVAATTATTAATATQALTMPAVAAATQKPVPPPVPAAWDAHLETIPKQGAEPWLTPEMQLARRRKLGLCTPKALELMERTEFISLGCFCAITRSLQALDLKRYSYPFDWVRSSMDGICHCLDTQFQDFLTYSTWRKEGEYTVFGGTCWGGSFWHHDLEAPNTRTDFARRIERLFGRGEVSAKTPRMFIRSVNATKEIRQAPRLLESLKRACPEAQVRLLLIVDVQRVKGPIRLPGELGEGILVYRIHESLYTNPQQGMPLQECSEAYAEAVGFAIGHWSGSSADDPNAVVPEAAEDLDDVSARLEHWDGGNAAEQLFCPRRFRGQQMVLPGNREFPGLLERCMVSNLWLPDGTQPGVHGRRRTRIRNGASEQVRLQSVFHTYAFGKAFAVVLPKGALPGHMLQVCLNDGVLTSTVYSLSAGLASVVGEAAVVS